MVFSSLANYPAVVIYNGTMSESLQMSEAYARDDRERFLDEKESEFYDALEKLKRRSPDARTITARWEREYERALEGGEDLDSFFNRFALFLDHRAEALHSIEINENVEPEVAAMITSFDRRVADAFGRRDLFIDRGSTAEVYSLPGHEGICVKYITDQERYNENNHLRTEFRYLDALSGLSYGHARLPRPYFLRIHPVDGHSYGMEHIQGKSLSLLLQKPEESPELIKAAKNMDQEAVLRDLVGLVELLHEHGVTHNDLKSRNIMFNTAGEWFIIDFGKARREGPGEDHERLRKIDTASLKGEIREFFKKLDTISI
jgi:tRNA A-37 threonylcarbamoyl transferase component Bud32